MLSPILIQKSTVVLKINNVERIRCGIIFYSVNRFAQLKKERIDNTYYSDPIKSVSTINMYSKAFKILFF